MSDSRPRHSRALNTIFSAIMLSLARRQSSTSFQAFNNRTRLRVWGSASFCHSSMSSCPFSLRESPDHRCRGRREHPTCLRGISGCDQNARVIAIERATSVVGSDLAELAEFCIFVNANPSTIGVLAWIPTTLLPTRESIFRFYTLAPQAPKSGISAQ
ncbi:hypothetical protein GGR57DRAFT_269714 [Xylariaceae sp. FL1272]|nr:hypothetical protein GGR57DRAFT_269714 [Xylariaceae sp. FL1272]